MIHRLLFKGKINIDRRAYLWNLVSSMAFSLQSALFLWIAARVSGAAEAGAFIILYTVAQTLYSVGNYNIRDYQVSDVRNEYGFQTYYTTRWITGLAMLALALGYCLYKRLDWSRCTVLFCLASYRLIECFEDVYFGDVQKNGRFDVASICMSLRIMVSSLAFCVGYAVTGDDVAASAVLVLASLAMYILLMRAVKREFRELKPSISFDSVWKLLASCFPIFIGAFLYNYLINAPKYAIDNVLSQEVQAVYNILFMPIFVINIFSMFVYKPQLVQMSRLWNAGDVAQFRGRMVRQVLIVAGFTVVAMLGGGLIGLRLLQLIYGLPLMEYVDLFVLLLGFGGIAAVAYYFNALIIILRKQHFILIGYVSALLISLLATERLVRAYSLRGAGYAYGLIMGFLMLFYMAVISATMVKSGRKKDRR